MDYPNRKLYWFAGWLYDFTKVATFFVFALVITHYFFFTIFIVKGASMEPKLIDGDIMLVNRVQYRTTPINRGDVIALYFPGEDEEKFVKRVIGLPGETVKIENANILINNQIIDEPYIDNNTTKPNQTVKLNDDEYFVMGDNREVSSDSRVWGPLSKQYIIGIVDNRLANKNQWKESIKKNIIEPMVHVVGSFGKK